MERSGIPRSIHCQTKQRIGKAVAKPPPLTHTYSNVRVQCVTRCTMRYSLQFGTKKLGKASSSPLLASLTPTYIAWGLAFCAISGS